MRYGQRSIRVLVVDDSAEDRDLYTMRLCARKDLSFHIVEAETLAQATVLLMEQPFDCIIVDHNLPDGEGIEFIRYVLSKDVALVSEKIPALVMVTGQGSEELAVEALKSGAHDYITKKSIADGMLIQPVLNAIERARLETQIGFYQEELERSNRELSEFAHTASHDLKSPLRRIETYCGILTEDAGDRLKPDEKQAIERMVINIQRMRNLVENLLTYSLVRSDAEAREETDTARILHEVIAEMEQQINESEGRVTMESLPVIHGYPFRIKQLFMNLLSNALKYHHPSRPPEVHVRCGEGADTMTWHYEFSDNGIGVPDDFQADVFRDFKRLHTQEDIEGTGLGLAICRKIVEKHGGRIWLTSEPGKGTTIHFTVLK